MHEIYCNAHLPKKLSKFLNENGHDSIHTLELKNKNTSSDNEINELSVAENRVVISKDSDFYDHYMNKFEPFKLLIISTGNISNKELMLVFEKNLEKIIEEISYNSVVAITKNSLITIY